MKTRSLAFVLVCLLLIFATTVQAQENIKPEELINVLVEYGYITDGTGELGTGPVEHVFEIPAEEDNMLYRQSFDENEYTDFVMNAYITWETDAESDDCGVLVRTSLDDENYYYISINRMNTVIFSEKDGGEWQDGVFEEDVEAIDTTSDATNNLLVIGIGDTFQVYVNGKAAGEFTDSSSATGWNGIAMGTYEDSGATSCSFSDVWVWSLENAEFGMAEQDTGTGTEVSSLTSYDQAHTAVMAELQDLGLVKGGTLVFNENYAYFEGSGNWFTPLARYQPQTNVVMGGKVTFTKGQTEEMETCGLLARAVLQGSGTSSYIEVGFISDGTVYLFDNGTQQFSYAGPEPVDLSQPHYLLFTVIDDTATVFLDGQLVIQNAEINPAHSGSFGISLMGKGYGARCEGHNIWVYTLD